MHRCCGVLLLLVVATPLPSFAADPLPPIPPIARLLPPAGLQLPEAEEKRLRERLAAIEKEAATLFAADNRDTDSDQTEFAPDIEIFTKAVRYALDLHEFYDLKKDLPKAHKLLDEAARRLAELKKDELKKTKPGWTGTQGLVVRGYRSLIDGSVQPYGIVWPENYDPQQQPDMPVYVWLHGRGDRSTDLHFIHERMTQVGQLGPVNAIVLHPFGRQCVGFKSAGEIDVLNVLLNAFPSAYRHHKIEVQPQRTVLIGFSMGGAGAWHIGAHHPHLFAAVAPGAGFAETARYTKTDPASVPWYERKLWGMYDVPGYTRNLFNTEVIAYSGENDKQMQAARVMEEAFKAEGRELTHLIGPGVAHAYEPKTLAEIKRRLAAITSRPPTSPKTVYLQSPAPCYLSTQFGPIHARGERTTLGVFQQAKPYSDTRMELTLVDENAGRSALIIATRNVNGFYLAGPQMPVRQIDGQPEGLHGVAKNRAWGLSSSWIKTKEHWEPRDVQQHPVKLPFCCGPIDHAFQSAFVLVRPTGKSRHPLMQRWVEFEMEHFIARWKALMRGDVRVKTDVEVLASEDTLMKRYHFICFGDPDSNAVIRKHQHRLPVTWKEDRVIAGDQSWPADSHVPVAIYPLAADLSTTPRYLVINSGLTFREAHDKTNAQQNPKLPDWAVLNLNQLPDNKSPGKVVNAGFFDENWQYTAVKE